MSIAQSYIPPTYEDLQAKCETKETPESHILIVHIPHGFARVHVGAKVEHKFGRVTIFGERPLGYNRSSRFNEEYQVPSYCDIKRTKGKFDEKTVTITMPKIPGAQAPKQEAPKQGSDEEAIPPQPPTEDDKEKTTAAEVKDNEKCQQGISDQDPKSTVERKQEAGHETSTPPEATKESMPQKGHEGIPQEAEVTKVECKGEVGHETSTRPEDTEDSMPQKSHEGIPPTVTTTDFKHQTEEKSVGLTDEKQRVGKEDNKDHPKMTIESGKLPEEKAVVDDSPTLEKESKEEREGPATIESFSQKNRETEKRKEINGKFGEKKCDKKAMPESKRTRKLLYMSAAVLVVSLGVYASYKCRSSRRP